MSWAERPVGMEAPGHDMRGGEVEAVLDQISLLTVSLGTIVMRTANQSIPNGISTLVTFPTIVADNMANFQPNDNFITVTRTGMYNVQFGVVFATAAGGVRICWATQNGVEIPASGDQNNASGTNTDRLNASTPISATAGDTISLVALHNATGGGAVNITAARLGVLWQGDLS